MKTSSVKLTALLLIAAMLFALAGCGGGSSQPINELHDQDYKEELVYPSSKLNAEALYASVTYSPKMFEGDYYLKDGLDSEADYLKNSDMWSTNLKSYNGEPRNVTLIPMHLRIGKGNFTSFGLNEFTEYTWGEASFLTENGDLVVLTCAVGVKNNDTLCLTPLEDIEQLGADEKYKVVSYTLSDTTLEYGFKFKGFDLTLSANGKSVELAATDTTDYMRDYGNDLQICTDGYLAANSPRVDNIDALIFLTNDKKTEYNRFYICADEGEEGYRNNYKATGILGEDGLFTFSYVDEEGAVHSYQFLYFYLDEGGIILYDGTATYYYTNEYYSDLDGLVSEEDSEQLASISGEQYAELVEKKTSLFDALAKAFDEAGIAAAVDPVSGEIAIDSAVLFDVNDSSISAEGEAFLTEFWDVYTSVAGADEYADFLAAIIVEGHADPSGNYEDNMVLSEARADSVLTFCEGLGESAAPLESVGYSSSRPIMGADGEVDYDASRRVAFKFRIKL